MTKQEVEEKLNELCSITSENEIVEFKEAKTGYDFGKLGKYFSALSNEANLNYKLHAWLVFGIENVHHSFVGTDFRRGKRNLDKLKGEIANKTTNRISFIEIHEFLSSEGRVLLFQIPAAPPGIPVAFDGHYYGRDGESLCALNIEKIERIRRQAKVDDWSAEVLNTASLDDLDPKAIQKARENYANKFPDKRAELTAWNDITFLNKAKITIRGKITRTAVILLGKAESEHLIRPAVAKIRWVLKDVAGNEKDYHISCCPLLLAIDEIYSKIRNLKYRYLQDGTLFPDEVEQYEPFIIREAINNCIAHQDYTKGGMINVVEMPDELIFTNLGSFIPGSVEKVIHADAPEEQYRNAFLANAMFHVKMVDTAGGGIRKMFNYQKERFFPLPEYDLSDDKVKVTITGKILDMDYARLLAKNKALSLVEIMMLDKVQKRKPLLDSEAKYLKLNRLIEGRKPNYYISQNIANFTGQKASYTKNKAFDKKYYLDLIIQMINTHKSAGRKDIDELLWDKLPDWMDNRQKKVKINNLLSALRKQTKIKNMGSAKIPQWVLINK
jgi:ATP-dependent DNA helicase RecG